MQFQHFSKLLKQLRLQCVDEVFEEYIDLEFKEYTSDYLKFFQTIDLGFTYKFEWLSNHINLATGPSQIKFALRFKNGGALSSYYLQEGLNSQSFTIDIDSQGRVTKMKQMIFLEGDPSLEVIISRVDAIFLRYSEILENAQKQKEYASSLNAHDSMTLLQQRQQGDEFVNHYLRGSLTIQSSIEIFRRYLEKKNLSYYRSAVLFPLEAQAIESNFDFKKFISILEKSSESVPKSLILASHLLEGLIEQFVNDLQRIITNAPRGFNIVLYRGIKVENPDKILYHEKSTSFLSCSTNIEVAEEFADSCCVLTLKIDKAQPILMFTPDATTTLTRNVVKVHKDKTLKQLDGLQSDVLNEQEVLIASNTPIEWISQNEKPYATISVVPTEPAKRDKPFRG